MILPYKFGDCEDYALAKRNALLNAGWPKDKLGLCVCYTQAVKGHCCFVGEQIKAVLS